MVNLLLDRPEAQKFLWVGNGEPHAIRRRLILAKYGEQVRKLYGYDHSTAWQVIGVVLVQLYMGYLVRSWSWGAVILAGYAISGTANQNLFSAQHEISHCLAFRRPLYNKILALASNLVLVAPVAVKFREYHHDHHLFLGIDGGDVDLPTVLEASWVANLAAKLAWGLVYLVVYGVRPLIVRPKAATLADAVNWVTTIGFNLLVLYFWGFKPVIYWLVGSILGGSLLHPMGGHLLAEHYMFEKGQETYSYYGPMNALTYNVGFHNEHHDFPQIPHTRLHKLRHIAPEFYEPIFQHYSWCWVLWKFFADPEVGPWLRVHRLKREGAAKETNERFSEYRGLYAVWRRLTDPSFVPGTPKQAHGDDQDVNGGSAPISAEEGNVKNSTGYNTRNTNRAPLAPAQPLKESSDSNVGLRKRTARPTVERVHGRHGSAEENAVPAA